MFNYVLVQRFGLALQIGCFNAYGASCFTSVVSYLRLTVSKKQLHRPHQSSFGCSLLVKHPLIESCMIPLLCWALFSFHFYLLYLLSCFWKLSFKGLSCWGLTLLPGNIMFSKFVTATPLNIKANFHTQLIVLLSFDNQLQIFFGFI